VSAIRAAFLGTPYAAVPVLVALTGVAEVVLVITRPDKPQGRSSRPRPCAVKQAATEMGLATGEAAGAADVTRLLTAAGPLEVAVVAAFGTIIEEPALAIPTRGMVNVHFSLLPRWRGAAPVAAALAAGDETTGVSLMILDRGLDTGPLLAAEPVVIDDLIHAGALTETLSARGAGLLVRWLPRWVEGRVDPVPQPATGATFARRLNREDRRLDVQRPATVLARQVRALTPTPGAVLAIDGALHQITLAAPRRQHLPAGEVEVAGDALIVGTGGGSLRILRLQPPGRREMSVGEWLRGLRQVPRRAS
jgi:methionyl-tRNA formyltransferase